MIWIVICKYAVKHINISYILGLEYNIPLKLAGVCYQLLWCGFSGIKKGKVRTLVRKKRLTQYFLNYACTSNPILQFYSLSLSSTDPNEDSQYI